MQRETACSVYTGGSKRYLLWVMWCGVCEYGSLKGLLVWLPKGMGLLL